MFKYYKILLYSILLFSFGVSEYQFINAFPNLTFVDPVGIYHAGDSTDRLFVIEQPGTIKLLAHQ